MALCKLDRSLRVMGAVAFALCFAGPVLAQWKWVDQNRQVQYSDLPPPPHIAEKDILQRPRGATAVAPAAAASAATVVAAVASAAGPKTVEPELEAKRRKAEQDQAIKAKADAKVQEDRIAAARAENCDRARADVRTLSDGGRLARSNARGEREVLDDRQREEELRRTRDLIAALCR